MLINPKNKEDLTKGTKYFEKLIKGDVPFELKEKKYRTLTQNSALHLYFEFIATELNNLGLEFNYQGLIVDNLSSVYTSNIVKEFIWRPIQITLFDIESTTKINTRQINEIINVITKYFGDKGVNLQFPSIETLISKNNEDKN